jgi:RNA polymerase sigma-70 factor, ECF subfamily
LTSGRQKPAGPSDDRKVSDPSAVANFRAVYEHSLQEVYGYLLYRCGDVPTAEDLTSETFLAAARALAEGRPEPMSVAWLMGVARHKLVDHWRRRGREERTLHAVEADADRDPWPEHLDQIAALQALRSLSAHHRIALTLRYLDDLPVKEVARLLHRTDQGTEALLARARAALRAVYEKGGEDAH